MEMCTFTVYSEISFSKLYKKRNIYLFSLFSVCSFVVNALQQAHTAKHSGELNDIAGNLQEARDVIQQDADAMTAAGQPIPVDLQIEIELIDAAIAVVAKLIQELHSAAKK